MSRSRPRADRTEAALQGALLWLVLGLFLEGPHAAFPDLPDDSPMSFRAPGAGIATPPALAVGEGCSFDPSMCKNGGRCNMATDTCVCTQWWAGPYCDDCPPTAVMNCTEDGSRCACAPEPCITAPGLVCDGRGYCPPDEGETPSCHCSVSSVQRGPYYCVAKTCIEGNPSTGPICNGVGYCGEDGRCVCPFATTGFYCQIMSCAAAIDPRYPQPPWALRPLLYCNLAGSCVSGDDGYFCHCLPNHTGELCENYVCSSDGDCGVHGICTAVRRLADGTLSGVCSCIEPYDGGDCSFNGCACGVSPALGDDCCGGAGSCQKLLPEEYALPANSAASVFLTHRCSCEPTSPGVTCEGYHCYDTEEDSPIPGACVHGSCSHLETNPDNDHCTGCPAYFAGKNCSISLCGAEERESENGTIVVFCSEHGHCRSSEGEASCVCTAGYAGPDCGLEDCKKHGCSGRGWCATYTWGDGAVCDCDDGYAGVYCDTCAPGFSKYVMDLDPLAFSWYAMKLSSSRASKSPTPAPVAEWTDGRGPDLPEAHEPGPTRVEVCAHPNCVLDGVVCSNHGACVREAGSMYACSCEPDYTARWTNECIHNNCVHYIGGQQYFCGYGGECVLEGKVGGSVALASSEHPVWTCKCADGLIKDSLTGSCFPSVCFYNRGKGGAKRKVCDGKGKCEYFREENAFSCVCQDNYVLMNYGCRLSTGIVVAITVPVVLVSLALVGLVIWLIIRKRKRRVHGTLIATSPAQNRELLMGARRQQEAIRVQQSSLAWQSSQARQSSQTRHGNETMSPSTARPPSAARPQSDDGTVAVLVSPGVGRRSFRQQERFSHADQEGEDDPARPRHPESTSGPDLLVVSESNRDGISVGQKAG